MLAIKERYTIEGRIQEADCFWCGYPMYSGDSAVMTSDDEIFCCTGCAKRYIQEAAEIEAIEAGKVTK